MGRSRQGTNKESNRTLALAIIRVMGGVFFGSWAKARLVSSNPNQWGIGKFPRVLT